MTHEEKIEGELTGISHRLAAIESTKKFYVYILRDPRPDKDMQPIYVGKGHGSRVRFHWNQTENHYNPLLRAVFSKIRAIGLNPTTEIAAYFNVEADAFCFEVELIAHYGRRDLKTGTLCNLTNGGEGVVGNLTNAENMRRRHTDPEFAKARNERARKQIRKLNADPEFVKVKSEQSRNVLRKLHTNPEFAKACTERIRKYNADPEFSKALAENMRKLHADPKFAEALSERGRKRMAKLNADPDFIRAKTERIRKLNADPNYQAKAKAGLATYWAKRRAEKIA